MQITMRLSGSVESSTSGIHSIQLREGQVFVIGRQESCDWQIADLEGLISRKHCTLETMNGRVVLTDHSSNGTFLDTTSNRLRKEQPVYLKDYQTLFLADEQAKIEFSIDRPEAEKESHWGEDVEDYDFGDTEPRENSAPIDPLVGGRSLNEALAIDDADLGLDIDPLVPTHQLDIDPLVSTHQLDIDPLVPTHQNTAEADAPKPAQEPDPGVSSGFNFDMGDLDTTPGLTLDLPDADTDRKLSFLSIDEPPEEPATVDAIIKPPEPIYPSTKVIKSRPALHPDPEVPPEAPSPRSDPVTSIPKELTEPAAGQNDSSSAESRAIAALFTAMGVSDKDISPEQLVPMFAELGRTHREMAETLRHLLCSRRDVKITLGIAATQIEAGGNPLKFARDANEAVEALHRPHSSGLMTGSKAVLDAKNELNRHHFALISGINLAIKMALGSFDPHTIEKKTAKRGVGQFIPMKRKAEIWDNFVESYQDFAIEADDDIRRTVGKELDKLYQTGESTGS